MNREEIDERDLKSGETPRVTVDGAVKVMDVPLATPETDRAEMPVVLPGSEASGKSIAPQRQRELPSRKERAKVTVAPNLSDLVTGRLRAPEDAQAAKEERDLNGVVHRVLILGLAVSTILMLAGLGLDLIRHREMATAVPDFGEVFGRVKGLRPSGFLALGLLVLIATPILRVIGSIFAFVYERDWRFAAVTFIVLVVVSVSLLFGKG